jgi:hypothetical protein
MATEIEMSDIPTKKPDLKVEELEGEYLVYDSSNEEVHNLNPTASFIWSLADGSRDVSFFVDEISRAASSDVNRETVEKDVRECLKEMVDSNLIDLE